MILKFKNKDILLTKIFNLFMECKEIKKNHFLIKTFGIELRYNCLGFAGLYNLKVNDNRYVFNSKKELINFCKKTSI